MTMTFFFQELLRAFVYIFTGDMDSYTQESANLEIDHTNDPVPTPPKPPKSDEIYEFAKSCLGRDIAATQNELGCAESISYIFVKCHVANFPLKGFLSTGDFYKWLQKNANLLTDPRPGDIIISPTGTSTKGAQHGHIGIVALHGILSNNSMNGLFQEYYNLNSWELYYGKRLGFPVLVYRCV